MNEIKVRFYVFALTDAHGAISTTVADSVCDLISISGKDAAGNVQKYHGPGENSSLWAVEYGMTVDCYFRETVLHV
jgi:hypothetical protein